jgi:hypothetical protein
MRGNRSISVPAEEPNDLASMITSSSDLPNAWHDRRLNLPFRPLLHPSRLENPDLAGALPNDEVLYPRTNRGSATVETEC